MYKVFVIDAVSPEECEYYRTVTHHWVERRVAHGFPTWQTLYTYTKMDLPCCWIPGVHSFSQWLISLVCNVVADVYNYPLAARMLHPRSWREPHLLRYQKLPGLM